MEEQKVMVTDAKGNQVLDIISIPEADIFYDLVYTDYVGKILYEDEYQVAVTDGGELE